MRSAVAIVGCAWMWVAPASGQTASFSPLSELLGVNGSPTEVSADGRFIVGSAARSGGTEAFRWDAMNGPLWLGDLPGGAFFSGAGGVSSDGNVVVGSSEGPSGWRAFRWTEQTGMVSLGDRLTNPDVPDWMNELSTVSATRVSAAGDVVVGYGRTAGPSDWQRPVTYRWTAETGMVEIASNRGFSVDVSADGQVVVGNYDNAGYSLAFRWTPSGGAYLDPSPNEVESTTARAVSADGTVVVGSMLHALPANPTEAFRWTESGGMIGLGDLAGGSQFSEAFDTSRDGAVVVGRSSGDDGLAAFLWSEPSGMVDLKSWLFDTHGLDLGDWRLLGASAISADGSTIVGWGTNPIGMSDGWVVRVPEPSTALLILAGGLLVRRRSRHA